MDKQYLYTIQGAYGGSKALVIFLKYSVFKDDTSALSLTNKILEG
jgi:hypothetical protein